MSNERATQTTASCDRRDFIKGAGYVVLAVQCLPIGAFASDVSLQETTSGDLLIKSGLGALRHVHYLRVPSSLLATPPERGATLLTTKALMHQHRVEKMRESATEQAICNARCRCQRVPARTAKLASKALHSPP